MNKQSLHLPTSIMFLLFCCCCVSKKNQIDSGNHINKIIADYYYDNKEITSNQKERIIKEFSELVSLKNLQNSTKFNGDNGVYSVSLSITHTTVSLLVLCNDKNYIYTIKPDVITKLRKNDCNEIVKKSNESNLIIDLKKIEADNIIIKSKNSLSPIQ